MEIRSLMTASPVCCSQGMTLQEAAKLMMDNDCGQIPVIDGARQPIGVITDRDIVLRGVAAGRDPTSTSVGDCMSAPVTTVAANCSLDDCCQLMERNKIRRVVVVDDRGICGIVAQADVALAGQDGKLAGVVKEVSEPVKSH